MTLPKENLDNKTYADLAKEAVSRIPIYAPGWTDHNVHDPGRTLIELFAWLAEMQIYSLNRITDRSKRKFLKLMGITELNPAKAAKVDVTFSMLTSTPTKVEAGTIVAASNPVSGEDILFETQQEVLVNAAKLMEILVHYNGSPTDDYISRLDANKNDNVFYYAFKSKPQINDGLYLGFNKDPGQDITLAIYLFKDGLAERGDELQLFPSGKVRWEYWDGSAWNSEELIRIDETNHLSTSGKIRIATGPMAKSTIDGHNNFWIRCVVVDDTYDIPPKIDQILLNTVPAIQRSEEMRNQFSSSGLPDSHLDIEHVPILDTRKDASKDGIPRITIGTEVWSKVEDFDASKPGDKHYIMDLETGRVTFGDDIHGMIPPEGENNILVSYRTGGGIRGNVKAGAINRVMADRVGPVSVTNHRSARSGEDAETLEEAIQRARIELRTPNRAVTSDDYERLAKSTPGVRVKRAKALSGYYPGKKGRVPGVVSVIAVPEVQEDNVNPEPSQGFMKSVYEHLDKHRLLTTEVFVLRSGYEKISVNADIKIYPKFFGGNIEEEVTKKLNSFLHPTKGGPKGDGWPFGRAVYISEIYEVINGVDGVDNVVSVVILTQNGVEHSDDIPIPAHSLVYPGTHQITIEVEKEALDA